MTTIIFTVLITYLVIGFIQLIINSVCKNDEAPLYFTCFWLIPFIFFVNTIYTYIKYKKIKKKD